jgi:hypothetical protein
MDQCINHGGKGNAVEAREVLSLQEDRRYGEGLPTRTGRIIKAEEGGPGKICLYHDQSAHQGAERKFYKDGHGGQGQGGFLKQRTGSTSVSPSLSIEHVQVAQIKKNTMTVDILILGESLDKRKVSKQQHYWTLEQEGNSSIRILSETRKLKQRN